MASNGESTPVVATGLCIVPIGWSQFSVLGHPFDRRSLVCCNLLVVSAITCCTTLVVYQYCTGNSFLLVERSYIVYVRVLLRRFSTVSNQNAYLYSTLLYGSS